MAKKTDLFANKFYGTVTESAANTLTFAEIPTNVDVFAKKAWVLHKLEWYQPPADRGLIVNSDDAIRLALCSSNKLPALALGDAGVIDLFELNAIPYSAIGTPIYNQPHLRDFSSLPGGGLIIAPRPLYIAVQGVSIAQVAHGAVRGYFTAVDLNADEYLELVDFYRIVQ